MASKPVNILLDDGWENDGGVSLRLDREEVVEYAPVFAVLFLGLLVRMTSLRGAIIDGDIFFYGSDSFYHMRRVLYTVDHFPHTLWFDSYLNYPEGLELMWPPLFDQLIAGTAILFGAESQRGIEIVGAVVPPILGTLTILALYFLARELRRLKGAEIAEPAPASVGAAEVETAAETT